MVSVVDVYDLPFER